MSIGVSDLRSWRFSIVFSKLSSFCSTMVEDSFSLIETISVSTVWFPLMMFLMLSFTTTLFLCAISNSFVCEFEMAEMD